MEEKPCLRLIKNATQGEFLNSHKRRISKMLELYPDEYFDPMLEALLDYICKCEMDDATSAIYYKLQECRWWWDQEN